MASVNTLFQSFENVLGHFALLTLIGDLGGSHGLLAAALRLVIRLEDVLGETDFGRGVGQVAGLIPVPTNLATVVGCARLPLVLVRR